MKNYFKITAVGAAMFYTMAGMANENDPKINLVSSNDPKSVVLEMDSRSDKSVIELKDSKENIIHYEQILKGEYFRKFNLKDLPQGTYYFTVESESESVIYTLNLKNNKVAIVNKTEKSTKPVLRKVDDKVYFNLLNPNLKDVNIKILNSNNESVFEESIKGELMPGKVFNFKSALKDSYTVIVTNGSDHYMQNIVVK